MTSGSPDRQINAAAARTLLLHRGSPLIVPLNWPRRASCPRGALNWTRDFLVLDFN